MDVPALLPLALESSGDYVPTAMVVAVVGTLAGAIAFLFKLVVDLFKKDSERAKEVGQLLGRQDGIETLARDTLEIVHKAATVAGEDLAPLADEARDKADRIPKPPDLQG
jgi:hypothetical protein